MKNKTQVRVAVSSQYRAHCRIALFDQNMLVSPALGHYIREASLLLQLEALTIKKQQIYT